MKSTPRNEISKNLFPFAFIQEGIISIPCSTPVNKKEEPNWVSENYFFDGFLFTTLWFVCYRLKKTFFNILTYFRLYSQSNISFLIIPSSCMLLEMFSSMPSSSLFLFCRLKEKNYLFVQIAYFLTRADRSWGIRACVHVGHHFSLKTYGIHPFYCEYVNNSEMNKLIESA